MAKTLYVGNLPYSWTGDTLRDLFSQSGTVTSASVVSDRETGRSKGFGFVEMESDADADRAIDTYNGYDAEGRKLRVNEARPKEERPHGSFARSSNSFRGRGF